jgi:hypothetical protein
MNDDDFRNQLIEAAKDKGASVERYLALDKVLRDSGIPFDQMSVDGLIYIVMHNLYARGATIEQIMWVFSSHISAFAAKEAQKVASNN